MGSQSTAYTRPTRVIRQRDGPRSTLWPPGGFQPLRAHHLHHRCELIGERHAGSLSLAKRRPHTSRQVAQHLSQPHKLRIRDRIAPQLVVPSPFIPKVEPSHFRDAIVGGCFRLGLVARAGLASNWMAYVGLSPLVRAIGIRRLIKCQAVDPDIEIGLFFHFSNDTFLFGFISVKPPTRYDPPGAASGMLPVPYQEEVMALYDCALIPCVSHQSMLPIPKYRVCLRKRKKNTLLPAARAGQAGLTYSFLRVRPTLSL